MKKKNISYRYFPQIKILLIVSFLVQQFLFVPKSNAQTAREYVLKSAFILRVANFVDWPENSKVNDKTKEFVIGIYGDNPFGGNLERVIEAKKIRIKGKRIKVKTLKQLEEIKTADILFISSSEKYNLSKVLKQAGKYPILTIGDTKSYAERGVMINTYLLDGYLEFDINFAVYKKTSFYISSKLLSEATKIIK